MTLWSDLRSLALAAAAGFALAPAAMALDFTAADNAFNQRENNRDNIAKARQLYLQLLDQATTANDKIRAVEQLGRLAFYEGELLLPKSDAAGRQQIFGDCWCKQADILSRTCTQPGWVEKISPEAIGQKVPAYYYNRGICVGYYGEASNVLLQAAFAGVLRDTVNGGLDIANASAADGYYEGGGVHRVAANVWSNPLARAVGLYDAKAALAQIELALAAPSSGGRDPGSLFYDNHRSKVLVLMQLDADDASGGWKQKAIDFADATLSDMSDRLQQNQLPAARVPEFKVFFDRIKDAYKQLTGHDWQAAE